MRVRCFALLVAALVACAHDLRAQAHRVSLPVTRDPAGPVLDLEIDAVIAAVRPGGFGQVRVRCRNGDDRAHRLLVVVGDGGNRGSFQCPVTLELGPREVASGAVLLPYSAQRAIVRTSVDDAELRYVHHVGPDGDSTGLSVLVVGSEASAANWQSLVEDRIKALADPSPGSGGQDPRHVSQMSMLAATEVRSDWRLISGFDLVIVDGRASGLDAERQAAFADHVLAGGDLIVLAADALGTGPLAEIATSGRRGFGRLLALDAEDCAALPGGPASRIAEQRIAAFLGDGDRATLARPLEAVAGPLPLEAYGELRIPGLGRPPLRGFFLLVLAFAIVVGPVNYFWCWRRKRLPLLLVTTCVLGIGTAAVVLAWGLFAEGFGVKQAEAWVTYLDQPRRHAVSWGTRTLYAGFAPGVLRPRAGTWTWCSNLDPYGNRAEHVFAPQEDGSLGGVLVPSRTPTTLLHVTLGPERGRLRFRRAGDYREVLAEAGFAPIGWQVVLRDLDGRWFIGAAEGRLEPVAAEQATRAIEDIGGLARLARAERNNASILQWVAAPGGKRGGSLAERLVKLAPSADGETFAPGTYLALVQHSPGADDLGVAGNTLASSHLVLGRIGQEDVVD